MKVFLWLGFQVAAGGSHWVLFIWVQERSDAMGARRIAIDSVSVFLYKIKDPQICREKMFRLASIAQNAQAAGFLATDISYGTNQISRFGAEETVVDGVILLSAVEEALDRQRYVEVYKVRNTAHLKGRHNFIVGKGGIQIFSRYVPDFISEEIPPRLLK